MQLHLSAEHFLDITRHVEAGYPREACGAFLGLSDGLNIKVREVLFLANDARSDQKKDHYLITSSTVMRLERLADEHGNKVLGFFHSHPDASNLPSATDQELAWPVYVYMIVPVSKGKAGEAAAYQVNGLSGKLESIEITHNSTP